VGDAGVEPGGVADHRVEGDPGLGDAVRLKEVRAVAGSDVDGRGDQGARTRDGEADRA
jgi:hypothetical protein